jgi:hypothetical protein
MIPKNPLTLVGTIDRCWLFVYQTPEAEARALVPAALELVTREGCAFWNIVVCRLRAMRPRGFPAFVGVSYWHVAYRFYVRFHPASGPPIEGLYFLRSDCDHWLMSFLGNALTDFRFHTAGIDVAEDGALLNVRIHSPDAPARATLDRAKPAELPSHSVFPSLDEAAAFLKYKPFGISLDAAGNANVVAIQRDEAAWKSRLVHVASAEWQFFEGKTVRPEICYDVEPIDYQWNRGRTVRGRGSGLQEPPTTWTSRVDFRSLSAEPRAKPRVYRGKNPAKAGWPPGQEIATNAASRLGADP